MRVGSSRMERPQSRMRSLEKWWIGSGGYLINVTFESGVVPEDWRYAVFVPPYKGKGEKTEGRIVGLLAWLEK